MKQASWTDGFGATGVITAIVASLCCITPVLALIAGVSGFASTFSWLEPVRPYLIGATVLILGFAWYLKLMPVKTGERACDCEGGEGLLPANVRKLSFWQSGKFLAIVTAFAATMLAFPYYSGAFFPDNAENNVVIVSKNDLKESRLSVQGMTCKSCEHIVTHALTAQEGVVRAASSYKDGSAAVVFDRSKITLKELAEAVERETGYKVSIRE